MTRQVSLAPVLCVALSLAAIAACGDDTAAGAGGQGASTTGGAGGGDGGTGGTGGSGGQWAEAPPLRNPVVDMSDVDVAYNSLLLLGADQIGSTSTTCSKCHSINAGLLESWKTQSDAAVATCLADPSVPSLEAAQAVVDCMRMKPGVDSSPFSTPKIGIYSGAAHLAWFDFVFQGVYGASSPEKAEFLTAVGMPKTTVAWTQPEFDIVAEWFARGLPLLNDLLPEDPGPSGCDQNITPAVGEHINAMKTQGWRAANADNSILMHGCAGAATALDCLASYPQAADTTFGDTWEHFPGAKLRVLKTTNYSSSYWTRSSADGRFVGHGGSATNGSTIQDLLQDDAIHVQAAYDPGFFPDNSGFIFQGTQDGSGLCQQSLLVASPANISFNEAECSSQSQVGLYQHVGATVGGGDYWAVEGYFVSDDGGHSATLENPAAFFDSGGFAGLTPMVFDGSDYVPKNTIYKSTAFEGDIVLSPSSRLLLSRVSKQGSQQNGFRLRKVEATPNGNSYNVDIPEIGRYCIEGGKPGISYDERWAVLHRYVTDSDAVELGFTGPNDPAFTAYANQGAANIYLLDLLTGLVRRVTHMKPGQYALFPHFRSDGWIYFMVRVANADYEYVVASDAALVVEAQ